MKQEPPIQRSEVLRDALVFQPIGGISSQGRVLPVKMLPPKGCALQACQIKYAKFLSKRSCRNKLASLQVARAE